MLGAVLRSGRQHRRALPVLEAVSASQQLILQEQKACFLVFVHFHGVTIPTTPHLRLQIDAVLLNAQWERAYQHGPSTGEVSIHGAADTKGRKQ